MSNIKNNTEEYALTDHIVGIGSQLIAQGILGKCVDVVSEALLPPELKAANKLLFIGGRYVLVAAAGISFNYAMCDLCSGIRKIWSSSEKFEEVVIKEDEKNSKKEKETV